MRKYDLLVVVYWVLFWLFGLVWFVTRFIISFGPEPTIVSLGVLVIVGNFGFMWSVAIRSSSSVVATFLTYSGFVAINLLFVEIMTICL